jgi:hypothetical protein
VHLTVTPFCSLIHQLNICVYYGSRYEVFFGGYKEKNKDNMVLPLACLSYKMYILSYCYKNISIPQS